MKEPGARRYCCIQGETPSLNGAWTCYSGEGCVTKQRRRLLLQCDLTHAL